MTPFQEEWIQIVVAAFVVFGGFALMSGQAIARTWRPWTQCIGYGLLLSLGSRLGEFVLFIGRAQTLDAYILDNIGFTLASTAYLIGLCMIAHRITLTRMMVTQYPWLYERAGLFSWRARA
ncbi:MAG: hypothetical protein IT563_01860 [Alphaproteobacteria bacterium]|nr:hypothetical protein [Alphaproteobacteria bacterium]